MSEYNVKVNNQSFVVKIKETENSKLLASVNNIDYEVSVEENIETFTVKKNNMTTNVIKPVVQVVESNSKTMIAPISGMIIKINIKKDQEIKHGDVIGVIEAMKMESELFSTISGKVKNIFIKEQEIIKTNMPVLEVY